MTKGTRVLVTGAMGALGRMLVPVLEARGHRVLATGRRHGERVTRMDVTNACQVEEVFERFSPEVCVHLAGEFGRKNGQENAQALWLTNCVGTHNVISASRWHNTRLVFASSSEAYGRLADEHTLTEDLLTTHVPSFHNEYALTKYANELQVAIALRKATILRFFNVYGPGEEYTPYRSVVCQFVYKALHGLPVTVHKGMSRSFLYVDDWAEAVANVLGAPNGTYNIGSRSQVPIEDLWRMVATRTGTTSEVTYALREKENVAHKAVDVTRAKEWLGLRQTPLDEGLEKTIAWQIERYGREVEVTG
jgi:dTDP-glucose 4,6-dehydratase